MHSMLQQIRSFFLKLSLQNTHGQLMANTKFTSLKNIVGVSLVTYASYKNCFSYRYLNTISLILSLCHPVGSGENWRFWRKPPGQPKVT